MSGITYSVESAGINNEGFIVRFDDKRDVALHDMTYGHEIALWESCGFAEDNGDVTGWMTAEEIVNRFYVSFDDPEFMTD